MQFALKRHENPAQGVSPVLSNSQAKNVRAYNLQLTARSKRPEIPELDKPAFPAAENCQLIQIMGKNTRPDARTLRPSAAEQQRQKPPQHPNQAPPAAYPKPAVMAPFGRGRNGGAEIGIGRATGFRHQQSAAALSAVPSGPACAQGCQIFDRLRLTLPASPACRPADPPAPGCLSAQQGPAHGSRRCGLPSHRTARPLPSGRQPCPPDVADTAARIRGIATAQLPPTLRPGSPVSATS